MPKSEEPDVIEGIVTTVYAASKNDAGIWRPFKVVVATEDGEFDCLAYPASDFETREVYEPIRLPHWCTSIDLATIEGSAVRVIAPPTINKHSGKVEYKKVSSFKVQNAAASAPAAQSSTTNQRPPQEGLPLGVGPRDAWNAEGQARGNSRTVASAMVAAFVATNKGALPDTQWLTAAAEAVLTFSEALLTGGVKVADEEPLEFPEEEESFGVLDVGGGE